MMSSDLAKVSNQLTTPAPTQATLLDMRMDSQRFPRIGRLTREEAVFEMSKIITQAFFYRGQQADQQNVRFISCNLVDELQSDPDNIGTKNISLAEIGRVVKRSVLQDDMFGISVASIYKVIIAYVKGEGHRLQVQASEMKRQEREELHPMIQAYAAELTKKAKI